MKTGRLSIFFQKIILMIVIFSFLFMPIIGKADVVTIGSDRISISMPKGYCALNESNPSDDRIIQFFKEGNKGKNKIIKHFADCSQLKLWRISQLPNLDDYGYVLVPSTLVNRKFDMSISTYLVEMKKYFNQNGIEALDNVVDEVETLMEKHMPTAKLNETKNLGIIFQDNYALYFGLLMYMQTEEKKSKNMLGVMGMTLIKGKPVNFYLWKKYQGKRTIYDLEGLVSSWVARIQSNN